MTGAERLTLSGDWSGACSHFGTDRADTPFSARLEEVAGLVTGSMIEPTMIGGLSIDACAALRGDRDGSNVTLRKTYDDSGDATHAIDHFGTLSADGLRISGFWRSIGDERGEGGFEMTRAPAGSAQAVDLETIASGHVEAPRSRASA